MWPKTEPRELYGQVVQESDELIFMDQGGDPIGSRVALETTFVDEYDEKVLAFQNVVEKKH